MTMKQMLAHRRLSNRQQRLMDRNVAVLMRAAFGAEADDFRKLLTDLENTDG